MDHFDLFKPNRVSFYLHNLCGVKSYTPKKTCYLIFFEVPSSKKRHRDSYLNYIKKNKKEDVQHSRKYS